MSKFSSGAICGLWFTLAAAAGAAHAGTARTGSCVDSPRRVLTVCLAADARGPYYEAYRGERKVFARSRLGPARRAG